MLAAWSISELAEADLGLGDVQLGARLVGAAERALERMGGRIYPATRAPTNVSWRVWSTPSVPTSTTDGTPPARH